MMLFMLILMLMLLMLLVMLLMLMSFFLPMTIMVAPLYQGGSVAHPRLIILRIAASRLLCSRFAL